MTTIRSLVRKYIQDIGEPVNVYDTYLVATEAGRTWTLPEENVITTTIVVYVNDVATTSYTYSPTTQRLVISESVLTLNDSVHIYFKAYKKYNDDELDAYIERAFSYASLKKYKDFYNNSGTIIPEPTLSEKRLLAVIAAICIQGELLSYKTKEFSIEYQKGMTVDQKIDQLFMDYNKGLGVFDWISLEETDEA